jgi:hypothetical protein
LEVFYIALGGKEKPDTGTDLTLPTDNEMRTSSLCPHFRPSKLALKKCPEPTRLHRVYDSFLSETVTVPRDLSTMYHIFIKIKDNNVVKT